MRIGSELDRLIIVKLLMIWRLVKRLEKDYYSRMGSIDTPTMVISGELDVPTPPSRMQLYWGEIKMLNEH